MIVFDTATIEQPLEGANPTLTQEYDEIINRYLARFDKENILARVKVKLIENYLQVISNNKTLRKVWA